MLVAFVNLRRGWSSSCGPLRLRCHSPDLVFSDVLPPAGKGLKSPRSFFSKKWWSRGNVKMVHTSCNRTVLHVLRHSGIMCSHTYFTYTYDHLCTVMYILCTSRQGFRYSRSGRSQLQIWSSCECRQSQSQSGWKFYNSYDVSILFFILWTWGLLYPISKCILSIYQSSKIKRV